MRPEIYPAILQSRRISCGAVWGRVKSKGVLFSHQAELEPGGRVADEITTVIDGRDEIC
jgi:hypothetical protein